MCARKEGEEEEPLVNHVSYLLKIMKDRTKEDEKGQEFDHVSLLLTTERAEEEFEAMSMLDQGAPPHHHHD